MSVAAGAEGPALLGISGSSNRNGCRLGSNTRLIRRRGPYAGHHRRTLWGGADGASPSEVNTIDHRDHHRRGEQTKGGQIGNLANGTRYSCGHRTTPLWIQLANFAVSEVSLRPTCIQDRETLVKAQLK